MNRALAALAFATLIAACSRDQPVTLVPSHAPPSPPPAAAGGPMFSGTYEVSATNIGTEGEPYWSATWVAEPTCDEGSCDSTLTISRPGFESYEVGAIFRHGRWGWRPVTALMCPDSGAPYQVSGQGFRMRPSRVQHIGGIETATALEGNVVAVLEASGCTKQILRYRVDAERAET